MEILQERKVNWNRVVTCYDCGTIFQTNKDDITVYFEQGKTTRYVQCPVCWANNYIGVEMK